MPDGQEPRWPTTTRSIELRWLSPAEAVDAQRRGEITLRRPTMANLRLFDGAASVANALASLAGRAIRTIRPRVITDPDGKQGAPARGPRLVLTRGGSEAASSRRAARIRSARQGDQGLARVPY